MANVAVQRTFSFVKGNIFERGRTRTKILSAFIRARLCPIES